MERFTRAEQKALSTPELKDFTRLQASFLRDQLNSLELTGVGVKYTPEIRKAALFEGRRIMAYSSLTDIPIAIVASSEMVGTDAPPITTLLISPTADGSGLLVDDETGTLWTDSFWICEGGRFKLVRPTEPIPIDGIDLTIDQRELEVFHRSVDINKRLYDLTDDKQWTREVLERAGVRIPNGVFLAGNSTNALTDGEAFISTIPEGGEVVLKADRGAHGDQVVMFDFSDNDVEDIRIVIAESISSGENIILEERVIPPTNPVLNAMLGGQEADYNFRVLTTLDSAQSRAIDMEIRFQPKSGMSVNISNQAQAARGDVLNNPDLIAELCRVAEAATNAVCAEVLEEDENILGFAGVDLILGKDGCIYVIEVNTGKAGGFGTLCRLDKKPLDSIGETLIPASLPYLEEVFQRRVRVDSNRLRRIPANTQDLIELYSMYMKGDRYLEAERIMLQLRDHDIDDDVIAGALAALGDKLGRFDVAEQYLDEIASNQSEGSYASMRFDGIRSFIEERKKHGVFA